MNTGNGWTSEELAAIQQHLATLTAHPLFTQAERLAHFLSFIVDTELKGESNKLNQNVIAIEVFERGADFDPAADSIVRVEAGRLRAKLREYYDTMGSDDGIRIELPKGSYIPHFQLENVTSIVGAKTEAGIETSSGGIGKPVIVAAIALLLAALTVYLMLKPVDTAQQTAPVATTDTTTFQDTEPVSVVLNKTPSIAVLPFVNMSGDPEQEYFSDGIAEEILNALARLNNLRVAARTSSFYFKGKNVELSTIAEKLNVNHVLEGSVRRSEDRLRITTKLIDMTNGFQLWSQSYDRKLEDIFNIQEDIAQAVVHALRLELDGNHRRLVKTGTTNLDAYNLYLEGKQIVSSGSAKRIRRAIELFENAVSLDPEFADAYAYIAYAHIFSHAYRPFIDIAPLIKHASENALSRNPSNGSALCAKAYYTIFSDWDWAAAGKLFQSAIRPGVVDIPCTDMYSFWYLIPLDRGQKSVNYVKEIEMLDPLNLALKWNLAFLLTLTGGYEEGQSYSTSVLEIEPDNIFALQDFVISSISAGKLDAAENSLKHLESLHRAPAYQFAISQRIHLEVVRGNEEVAREVFNKAYVEAKSGRHSSPGLWWNLSMSAVLLGELDMALSLFKQAMEVGAAGIVLTRAYLTQIPAFKENGNRMITRQDFQAFLARMKLDDESIKKYKENQE